MHASVLYRIHHILWSGSFFLWLIPVLLLIAGCSATTASSPYSAKDALETFVIADGFRVDLIASEPLVMDPVAMTIDEHGRIFVAEMPGYPLDVSGTGRVKLLHDTDGDGQPDQATTFAEGLRLPTGIMRWREGVIVTDPPDVLYLADTTQDGVADIYKVMLTGFALSNPQHNANTPLYGLDNWIYIANNSTISWTKKYADPFGDRGSEVLFPEHPDGPRLPRNGADLNLRFKPDIPALENLSNQTQFGHTFDAWGRHFLVDNSHHHMHSVLPARFFGQGGLDDVVSDTRHYTPGHRGADPVFPITIDPEHQLLTDRGVFTSACGLTFYLGGLFPEPYDDQVSFVAEPVHNLIHVSKVLPDGPTFRATRIQEGREFLASTDSWFRPVNFSNGPDGALYMVDYYRQIVEHPEWMDDSLAANANLVRGTQMGRIYRIVPEDAPPVDWHDATDLGETETLVQHLSSSNVWWRKNAQRLLVDQKDPAAIPLIRDLLETSASPESRLHALWALEGLGALTLLDVRKGLQDPHPGVRENAVVLASQYADLEQDIVALANDPDARVRFEVLGTLGQFSSPQAEAAQYDVLWRDINSKWIQLAALLSLKKTPDILMQQVMQRPSLPAAPKTQLLERISTAAGILSPPDEIARILTTHSGNADILRGIATGLRRRGARVPLPSTILNSLASQALVDQEANSAIELLDALRIRNNTDIGARALAVLEAADAPAAVRARAVDLLGLIGTYGDYLATLLSSEDSLVVRRSALRALRQIGGPQPALDILAQWPTFTPSLREEALEIFNNNERAALLIDALRSGNIQPTEIPWQYRVRLMRDTDEPVRSAARELLRLSEATPGSVKVPDHTGDPEEGRAIFEAVCGICHMAGTVGSGQLGPDLATVQHWPPQALMDKVVNPNRQIASGYEQWIVERTDGTKIQGIVTAETPSALTIANQAQTYTLSRTDIVSMTALATSAMPPELLGGLDEAAIADLLAFLSGR